MKAQSIFYPLSLTVTALVLLMVALSANALPASQSLSKPDSAMSGAQRIPIRWFVGLGAGSEPSQLATQQQVVSDFNASQSTISLTLEVVHNPESFQILLAELASGNAPDIVGPVGIFGASYFRGQWLDLLPIISSTGYDLSDYDPTLVNYFKTEEGQANLPFAVYPSFVYYNKSLFDQAGLAYPPHQYGQPYTDTVHGGDWTTDKLAEIARLMTLDITGTNAISPAFDAGHIVQFGDVAQWTDARGEATLFGANSFVDANGDAQIPANWRAAFQWYYDAMWGSQPFIPNSAYVLTDRFGNGNPFNSGRIAMAQSHSWYLSFFGSPNVTHWDIAATPSYSGTTTSKLHADGFRILKASQHPIEAFQVMTYLIGTAAPTLIDVYDGFPARISQQTAAVNSLKAQYPGVDWQVMIDSIQYADNPNHEGYMPNFPDATQRISQFYSSYHGTAGLNIDNELDTLRTVLQTIFHGSAQTAVNPTSGGTLAYYGAQGLDALVQVPAGAVVQTTTLTYAPVDTATAPSGLVFASHAFDLNLGGGTIRLPSFTFSEPVTITVFYADTDVAGIFENSLKLYYLDGSTWKDVSDACTPPSLYDRHPLGDSLSVPICHLSRFALFGPPEHKVYLPLVMRN